MLKKWIAIFLLLFRAGLEVSAQQIPIGHWRQHPSFKDTRLSEAADNYIYAASAKGFFRVHIKTGEIKRLSAEEGFHAKTITAMEYFPALQTLVIGYTDGFIELLKNNRDIYQIPGFYNKLLQGDKSILHIDFEDRFAHISTWFGILVVDLNKIEISDSYSSIAPGGQNQEVYCTAISGDSIYAGIPDGIIAARYHPSVNLNDHNNWKKVYAGKPVFQLTEFHDSLFFYSDTLVKSYKSGMVQLYPTAGKAAVRRIKTYDGDLCVFRPGAISRIKSNGSRNVTLLNVLTYGSFDKDGFPWFTTGTGGGLIKITPGGEISFEPNGPSNNSVFAMSQSGDLMFTTAGGVTNTFGNAFNDAGFYFFENFNWRSNPVSVYNVGLYDYTYVTYNPLLKKYYIASHTNGLLEFTGNEASQKYDENNSPLKRDVGSGFIRVSGLAPDKKGVLWVANYGSSTPLLTLNSNGVWKAVVSNELTEVNVKNLIIDENGYKWMIVQSGGVFVFDDNETPENPLDDRSIKLTTSHGLITNDVISIKGDKNGYVWIGTTQGLNVVTNTFGVFEKPKADRFVIEQDGNTGYLLGEESINDICVDGGNRKWFATNNGVFAVEPNGQEVLANYRADNSPLPDDKIYCIGQIGASGEMFFGTEAGICSYRNDASESEDVFSDIKIYPNPVKPGYTGLVTIEGLATDAEVRIADATGVMVYKTKANGGTATWPCTRLDGTRPNSGVYYIFGVNADGTETAMGKFVFIR